jgi:alkane 1-monooxygenase
MVPRSNSTAPATTAAPVFLPYIVVILIVWSHNSSRPWHTLIPPAFVWIVIPIIDFAVGPRSANATPPLTTAQRRALENRPAYSLAIILWVPVQIALLVWAARRFTSDPAPLPAIALLLSMSLVSAEGINCAHELLHRTSVHERLLGQLLLVSVCYGHFFIEHSRGHHKTVATPDDPATLAYGESFYAFLPRTIVGGFRSAWRLEASRVARAGCHSPWHPSNMVLVFCVAPLLLFVLPFAYFLGRRGVTFFLAQAAVAIVLLEQINAIEHYGLRRARLPNGEYEPVGAEHSWDASHPVSNLLLFKLQRHADHHMHAGKRYQTLDVSPESPQLPYGYLTLAPCLLLPPLWRAIMDPVLHEYQRGIAKRRGKQECVD